MGDDTAAINVVGGYLLCGGDACPCERRENGGAQTKTTGDLNTSLELHTRAAVTSKLLCRHCDTRKYLVEDEG